MQTLILNIDDDHAKYYHVKCQDMHAVSNMSIGIPLTLVRGKCGKTAYAGRIQTEKHHIHTRKAAAGVDITTFLGPPATAVRDREKYYTFSSYIGLMQVLPGYPLVTER